MTAKSAKVHNVLSKIANESASISCRLLDLERIVLCNVSGAEKKDIQDFDVLIQSIDQISRILEILSETMSREESEVEMSAFSDLPLRDMMQRILSLEPLSDDKQLQHVEIF